MHILVVNDDGPPSNQSSPYVHSLIVALQQAGHTVSVCLPHVQRSWIGKAHIVGQTLTPSYFRPGTILQDDGIHSETSFNDGKEEWILLDGTPASCAQIGIHHLFKERGPVDLLLSGPNYGRNTTAVFALSSGTLGGAMEGAVNGVKSIALSYAFDSREHDVEILAAASRISTKLVEKFYRDWPADVHVYSINVPLRAGVEQTRIVYTAMIQNRWVSGSSFTELPGASGDADPNAEEHRIREDAPKGPEEQTKTGAKKGVTYKWSPTFQDVRSAVEKAGSGDGWEVLQGHISVTPLRANFWHLPQYSGDIKLDAHTHNSVACTADQTLPLIYAVMNKLDPYVQPLLRQALARSQQTAYQIIDSLDDLPKSGAPVLQFSGYEDLDFEYAREHEDTTLVCAYVIRKALIRKHYLSNTVAIWMTKHPDSSLVRHYKAAVHFELDFAEFLDDALIDAWDLNESMTHNEGVGDKSRHEWWILKPGMSDGGNGIRLFSTLSELQQIFEEWDPDEDDECDNEHDGKISDRMADAADQVMTSQLRHFIAQPYIEPPLLLPSYENRKFHLRVYVVAVGSLKVYVYKEMLALFAATPYMTPGAAEQGSMPDLARHLTNTCFQDESTRAASVHRFWALQDTERDTQWQDQVFAQICTVTGEVFEAAAREQMIHFQTTPNAFEIFGVDFLVDAQHNVWLLEVNAYPDFKQTGDSFRDTVIGSLFDEVVQVAINPFFGHRQYAGGTANMPLVKQIDLGRR